MDGIPTLVNIVFSRIRFVGAVLPILSSTFWAVLFWAVAATLLVPLKQEAYGQNDGQPPIPEVLRTQAQELRTSIATDWEAFSNALSLASVTAEERGRRVEAWRATNWVKFEQLRELENQIGVARAGQDLLNVAPIPVTDDVLLTDINATHAEIREAMRELLQTNPGPVAYIRNLDEFLRLNRQALADQNQRYVQLAARTFEGQQAVQTTVSSSAIQLLTSETRILAQQVKSLPPEARISAIEAKRTRLRQLQEELAASIGQR